MSGGGILILALAVGVSFLWIWKAGWQGAYLVTVIVVASILEVFAPWGNVAKLICVALFMLLSIWIYRRVFADARGQRIRDSNATRHKR